MFPFFRFPHTPHIVWIGSTALRNDKILTPLEVEELFAGEVIVEEKVDGANIGLSLDENGKIRVQNRGDYLREPFLGQFRHLPGWLRKNELSIAQNLKPELLLFGEWCAARHSLGYSKLPDYFLLFDVYDRGREKFWSADHRNTFAEDMELKTVPRIGVGHYSVDELQKLLVEVKSRLRDGRPEGIVVRKDDEMWNLARGKVVQLDFLQSIEDHWSGKVLEWNKIN